MMPNMATCPACGRSPAQYGQAMAAQGYAPGGYGQPAYGYGGVPQYIYQSRGSTILVLGILSLVVCSVLGPIAWSMGNEEQRRIAAGQTPPDSNVGAGKVCGM